MIFLIFLAAFSSTITFTQATTVCYGKHGCFSDDPPFNQPFVALPSDPEEIGTIFRLYTRDTTLPQGEILDTDNTSSISNSTLDPLKKVKFIVHGFTQDGLSPWVTEMRQELLKKEKMNVIVVDWGLGSSVLNLYDAAAGNTRVVGAQLAEMINVLSSKFHVTSKKFHVIGHSLGAQVAGFAGERLVKLGKVIGRITGMDPAGPGFDVNDAAARLDPSDAMFVDVIHTDIRSGSLDSAFGLQRSCGHVDFYPNGGKQQPGCGTTDVIEGALDSFFDEAQVSLPWIVACNHMKSVAYFTASINSPCAMKAFPCNNWEDFQGGKCLSCSGACPQMGYNADQYRGNKPAVAFLQTVEERPFCAGDHYYGLTIHSKGESGFFFSSFLNNEMKITLTGSKGEITTDEARDVTYGQESFILSSARDIGPLQSIQVQFKGSGFFLKKIDVYSKFEDKRYTASFEERLGSYLMYLHFSSYNRNLVASNKR